MVRGIWVVGAIAVAVFSAFSLVAAPLAAATVRSASAADGPDTPDSFLDIDSVRLDYDDAGRAEVAVRLVRPLDSPPPAKSGASVSLDLTSSPRYPGCGGSATGDVRLSISFSSYYGDPPPPRASYDISGRYSGARAVPVSISGDRREMYVTIVDSDIARRDYACFAASSNAGYDVVYDRASDSLTDTYFPGFAPRAAEVRAPAEREVLRGTAPILEWSDFGGRDTVELFSEDPAEPGSFYERSFVYLGPEPTPESGATYERDPAAGVRRLRLAEPPEVGDYWWKIKRTYGSTTFETVRRFRVGPPALTTLRANDATKRGRTTKRPSITRLGIRATRYATVAVLVKLGRKNFYRKTFQASVAARTLTFPGSCKRPGTFKYTVTARDEYGGKKASAGRWSVSRARCAFLRRAEQRARAQARKKKSASRRGGCEPGYSPCLPRVADLDCGEISPSKKPIRVTGSDRYGLDRDNDGYGCE